MSLHHTQPAVARTSWVPDEKMFTEAIDSTLRPAALIAEVATANDPCLNAALLAAYGHAIQKVVTWYAARRARPDATPSRAKAPVNEIAYLHRLMTNELSMRSAAIVNALLCTAEANAASMQLCDEVTTRSVAPDITHLLLLMNGKVTARLAEIGAALRRVAETAIAMEWLRAEVENSPADTEKLSVFTAVLAALER